MQATPKVQVNCAVCGKQVERSPAQVARVASVGCGVVCGRILSGRTRSARKRPAEETRRVNAAKMKQRAHRLKAQGLCVHCGGEVEPGRTMCAKQLGDLRQRACRRYAGRKAAGLCLGCGEPLDPETGRTSRCIVCAPAPALGTLAERRRRKAVRLQRVADNEKVRRDNLRAAILPRLTSLRPRELEVLRLRYGLRDGVNRTLQEIGDIFGVTREAIRQTEERALAKLEGSLPIKRPYTYRKETYTVSLARSAEAMAAYFIAQGITDVLG